MIAQRNPEIRKAANALYVISADPEVRLRYERQEKDRMDRESLLADAIEDAVENTVEGERNIWQSVVAEKDAELERLRNFKQSLAAKPRTNRKTKWCRAVLRLDLDGIREVRGDA